MYTQKIGKRGEALAARWLQQQGFVIVGRNLHTRYGEIDVLALRDGVLHLVEVKTRTNDLFGSPVDAITRQKIQKLKRCLQQLWLEGMIDAAAVRMSRISIDVACIRFRSSQSATIELIWNINEDDCAR